MTTKKIVDLIVLVVGRKNVSKRQRAQLNTIVDMLMAQNIHLDTLPADAPKTGVSTLPMETPEPNSIEQDPDTVHINDMHDFSFPEKVKVKIEGQEEERTIHLHPFKMNGAPSA